MPQSDLPFYPLTYRTAVPGEGWQNIFIPIAVRGDTAVSRDMEW